MAIKTQLRLAQISGSLGHTADASAFRFSVGTGIQESYINFDTQNKKLELGDGTVEIQLDGDIEGSAFLNENNMSSNSATKLASQASIKAYVDSVAQGLSVKQSVKVASTGNLVTAGAGKSHTYAAGSGGSGGTITKDATGVEQIDGRDLLVGDRVLLKDQSQSATNGIYSVTTRGTALAAAVLSLGFDAGIPANNETLKITIGSGSEQTVTFRDGTGSSDTAFSTNAADIGTQGQTATQVATAVRTLLGSLSGVTGGGSGDLTTATGQAGLANNITRGTDTMGDGGSGPSVSLIAATDAAAQVLTRAIDADGNAENGNAELSAGCFFFVVDGAANADVGFVMSSDSALPANNAATGTAISFTQFSSAGVSTASNGIVKSVLDFQLDIDSLGAVTAIASGDTFAMSQQSETDDPSKKITIDNIATKLGGTGLTPTSGVLAVDAAQAITSLTGGDLTIFDDQNNADVSFSMGTSATEALKIEVLNGGSNKSAEEIRFQSLTAGSGADAAFMSFYIDAAEVAQIRDDGFNIAENMVYKVEDVEVLSATALGSSVVGSSLTSVGTLTALQVDDVNINGKVISVLGDTDDTFSITVGGAGATTLATVDDAGTDGHMVFDVDGNIELNADGGTITFADASASLGTITSAGYSGTSAVATAVTVSDNESTDEENLIAFVAGAADSTGNHGLEMDGNLTYNPNTGKLTATQLGGLLMTAAQGNITSVGSLSATQIASIELGNASDTTLARKAAGKLSIEGQEIGMKTFKEHLDVTPAAGFASEAEITVPTSSDDSIAFNVRFRAASADEREVYVNGQLLLEGSSGVDDWYSHSATIAKLNFALEQGDVIQFVVRHKGS